MLLTHHLPCRSSLPSSPLLRLRCELLNRNLLQCLHLWHHLSLYLIIAFHFPSSHRQSSWEHRSTSISASSVDITVVSMCLIHRNSKAHFKCDLFPALEVCLSLMGFLGCCNKPPALRRVLMTYYILTMHLGGTCIPHLRVSMVAQWLENLPAMQETWFSPWVGQIPWGRKWQPTPVFLPGEFHGQKSLEVYSLWGRKELRHNWVSIYFIFMHIKYLNRLFSCKNIVTSVMCQAIFYIFLKH